VHVRDVGAIVWVLLVVVGVVSSIVSNARKQNRGMSRPAPPVVRHPLAPPPPPQPQSPAPPAAMAASRVARGRPEPSPRQPEQLRTPPQAAKRPLHRLFGGDRASVVRAVIAAEVLGKPVGLRDTP